jgi:hypothetical protein
MSAFYKRSSLTQAVECDGEWVILHISNDTITKLNDTAGSIWAVLNKSMTARQLILSVSDQDENMLDVSIDDVELFLEHLVQMGLVEKL